MFQLLILHVHFYCMCDKLNDYFIYTQLKMS